jgi:hypothetical protein
MNLLSLEDSASAVRMIDFECSDSLSGSFLKTQLKVLL